MADNEKFEYFKHPDRKPFIDRSQNIYNQTKWTKVKGGAIGHDEKMNEDKKRAQTPGPGNYNPILKQVKKRPPSYFLGEKNSELSIKLMVGTNDKVGPGSYVTEGKFTSKHQLSPHWKMPVSKRRPLSSKPVAKTETYYLYSAIGDQVMSNKKTEVKNSIGKEKKDKQNIRGIFPAHMSFKPASIALPHPKI